MQAGGGPLSHGPPQPSPWLIAALWDGGEGLDRLAAVKKAVIGPAGAVQIPPHNGAPCSWPAVKRGKGGEGGRI